MTKRRGALVVAIAATVLSLSGGVLLLGGTQVGATGTEVLGYGNQLVAGKNDPPHAQFGIFSAGTGNTAKGEISVWQSHFPLANSPFAWITASVTCSVISGHQATITGKVTIGTHTEIVVAQMVDNSDPSSSSKADELRFSYAPTIHMVTPGCWTASLGPLGILSGDIRVGV